MSKKILVILAHDDTRNSRVNKRFAKELESIENVEIIAGNENDTQIVYNLNGQVVNGNLNSLQKGIYIKNGKKFMVK